MLNATQFLESLGRGPASACLNMADHAAALALLEIDDAQRQALLARDAGALAALLDARPHTFCLVATPDGGETQDEPDQPGKSDQPDQGDEEPAKTDDVPQRTDRPD